MISCLDFMVSCVCVLSCFVSVWLCDLMDHSPPGFSVHGILQARILEWVAMPTSRGPSWRKDWTHIFYVPWTDRQVLYHQRHLGSPLCNSHAHILKWSLPSLVRHYCIHPSIMNLVRLCKGLFFHDIFKEQCEEIRKAFCFRISLTITVTMSIAKLNRVT